MPEAEWKAKIDLYYNSDFCVLKGYGLTREQIFSEPWEVGIARFGMQTLPYNAVFLRRSGQTKDLAVRMGSQVIRGLYIFKKES